MIRRRPVNRYNSDGLSDSNRQRPDERRSEFSTPDRNVTVDVENKTVEINTPVAGFKASADPTIEQPYLVPLGIPGFYQSPAEPVDPTDCERWPDSPYCGGTGVNLDDFRGLDFDVHANPCEVCVTLTPTLGFISLPPYTVCRRSDNPECKLPGPPPPPAPGRIDPTDQQLMDYLGGFPPGCRATIQYARWVRVVPGEPAPFPSAGAPGDQVSPQIDYRGNVIWNVERAQQVYPDISGGSTGMLAFLGAYGSSDPQIFSSVYEFQIATADYRLTELILWVKSLNEFYYEPDTGESTLRNSNFAYAGVIVGCSGPDDQEQFAPRGPAIAPPYPLPCTPCEDDMACCSSESEELLRLIARRLGTDQFPAKVPRSLSADDGNATTQIQSLAELMGWYIRQFDALVGQFPIEITFDDIDPLKEGDQKKTLRLPNIAETLAELMGVSTLTSINSNTLVDGMVRNLIEANAAKTYALKGQYLAQAIADYLSFDTKEVRTPVPCSFTPGKTEFDDLLRESDQKVELTHYDDQRDFEDELKELLAAAAVIKAVHYRKYRGSQDLKDQVKNRFKELINLAEKGSPNPSDSDDSGSRSDFDTFVEDVESGFANTAGVSDTLNPYGKPYSQRPKIRELGNTSDQTDARNL